ncbi:hypothetical protein C1645_702462, partial [Glomus cerebriforme]
KVADLGHKVAKRNLAILYKNGEGVQKNNKIASELFKELYEEGYSNLLNILGDCIVEGEDKDSAKEFCVKKISDLLTTFASGMSDTEIFEFAGEIGKTLTKLNSSEIVDTYKTGEGIVKNVRNLFYWTVNVKARLYDN